MTRSLTFWVGFQLMTMVHLTICTGGRHQLLRNYIEHFNKWKWGSKPPSFSQHFPSGGQHDTCLQSFSWVLCLCTSSWQMYALGDGRLQQLLSLLSVCALSSLLLLVISFLQLSSPDLIIDSSSLIRSLTWIFELPGASIPSFFFSSAPGWRMNFVLQLLVILIRIAVVTYIVWWFADEWQDIELASNRICQLATILLSTSSLSPLIYMSMTSSWLITMQPGEELYLKNIPIRRQRAVSAHIKRNLNSLDRLFKLSTLFLYLQNAIKISRSIHLSQLPPLSAIRRQRIKEILSSRLMVTAKVRNLIMDIWKRKQN